MHGIGLTPQLLSQTFPFHIAFRSNGLVVQAGAVIERMFPGLVGTSIADTFRIDRPQQMDFDVDLIRHHPRTVFVLQTMDAKLRLKGQMLPVDDAGVMIFLGSPWITELSELSALDLRLGDFAVHDQVVDCLFLIQAQQAALSDVRRLASQQSVKLAQQQAALLEAEKLARERLEKELELARQIQVGILPRQLAAEGLELTAAMTTAAEVGGR